MSLLPLLPLLRICALDELETVASAVHPDLIISITDPDPAERARADGAIARGAPGAQVLRLEMHDICEPMEGCTAPDAEMVEQAVTAAQHHLPSSDARLLVHCHAGLSRSPSIALAALAGYAESHSGITSTTLADAVQQAAPFAIYNAGILDLIEARNTRILGSIARAALARVPQPGPSGLILPNEIF